VNGYVSTWVNPFTLRPSAIFGINFAKGDFSPAARNNGTSFGPRNVALNFASAGSARYISNTG